jgi:thioredoxin-dependent peroxiredoxin
LTKLTANNISPAISSTCNKASNRILTITSGDYFHTHRSGKIPHHVATICKPESSGGAMLKEGSKAPAFSALDDRGCPIKLSDYAGKKDVVLFFYPKADTPGCTREACGFRDAKKQIEKKGAVVLGISADAVDSQAKFRDKYGLNMPLLADPDRQVIEAYGVYKEKNMYGKKVMGIERTTFIIGKDGTIKRIFPKVKVDGHIEEVVEALNTIR